MQNRIIDVQKTESSPTEPVTLTEVKSHMRITIVTDDTELTSFITRIRKRVEDYCSIALVDKDIVVIVDLYKRFRLPFGATATLATVELKSVLNQAYETLVEDTDYVFEAGEIQSYRCGRHRLTYSVEATAEENIKLAILEEIAYHYENKGEETNKFAGEQIGFSTGALTLMEPFRDLSWI